jgi:hypothetical protein
LPSFVVCATIAFAVAITVISRRVDCCLIPQFFPTNPLGGSNHDDSVHVDTPTPTPTVPHRPLPQHDGNVSDQ